MTIRPRRAATARLLATAGAVLLALGLGTGAALVPASVARAAPTLGATAAPADAIEFRIGDAPKSPAPGPSATGSAAAPTASPSASAPTPSRTAGAAVAAGSDGDATPPPEEQPAGGAEPLTSAPRWLWPLFAVVAGLLAAAAAALVLVLRRHRLHRLHAA